MTIYLLQSEYYEENLYSFKSKIIHILLGFGCPILDVTISTLLGNKRNQI